MAILTRIQVAINPFFTNILSQLRSEGFLHTSERATPTGFQRIPYWKNLLGAVATYAAYMALKPYYDKIIAVSVNGAGVDLICFKDGKREFYEVKNWASRYATGPSMTPNKYKHEVHTRYPLHTKSNKILVTSATWSDQTGLLMREDNVYPYQFPSQITSLETFNQAIMEIRYQHELRIWKQQEERRLFNISSAKSLDSDAYSLESDDEYLDSCNKFLDGHLSSASNIEKDCEYGPTPGLSPVFDHNAGREYRCRLNEMQVYKFLAYPEDAFARRWKNQMDEYYRMKFRARTRISSSF